MMTANAAKILAGKYNEPFKLILSEIKDAAFARESHLKLDLYYHKWLNDIGFKDFKEVLNALGYTVYNNENHFRVSW